MIHKTRLVRKSLSYIIAYMERLHLFLLPDSYVLPDYKHEIPQAL